MSLVRKGNRIWFILVCFLVLTLFWAAPAQALMLEFEFDELTKDADAIIVGTVENTESFWNNKQSAIYTLVTVNVKDVLKGDLKENAITIVTEGGTVGSITQWDLYEPVFAKGDTAGLFLEEIKDSKQKQMGLNQTQPGVDKLYYVYGLFQGVFIFDNNSTVKLQDADSYTIKTFKEDVSLALAGKPLPVRNSKLLSPTSDHNPVITSITPSTASAGTGTEIVVNGRNFGTKGGSDNLQFFYKTIYGTDRYMNAEIISWTDTEIRATVPIDRIDNYPYSASSGPVAVYKSGRYGHTPFSVTFGFDGKRWPGTFPIINYSVNPAGVSGRVAAIQAAAMSWNNAGAMFNFVYDGTTDKTVREQDGHNVVIWEDLRSGVIGAARIWSDDDSNIIETDFAFSTRYNWNTADTCPPDQMDVQTTAVHEMGHWLFLRDLYGDKPGYPQDTEKIMYGFGFRGQIKRTIHEDDRDGIVYIYGATGATYNLTVNSTNPSTGVLIDSYTGHGGTTSYSRLSIPQFETVSLEAPEYHGSGVERKRFSNWSGAATSTERQISLPWSSMNKTVTANYINAPETYTLTVNSINPSAGVLIASASGHGGTTAYSLEVIQGGSVSLTAPRYVNSGMERKSFSHWTGIAGGTDRTITFTMNANLAFTANYDDDPEGPKTLPYCEDFSTWPPGDWSNYQLGGQSNNWEQQDEAAWHGPGMAGDELNNWLVSPALVLPDLSDITLIFKEKNERMDRYGFSGVLISTGSSDPNSGDYQSLYESHLPLTAWTDREIDLTAFAGNTVFIAFQYKGNDGHSWWIDDFCVFAGGEPSEPVWRNITSETAHLLAFDNGILAASFNDYGIWLYDGDWNNIASLAPQAMAYDDGFLVASFNDYGVWSYDGEWSLLVPVTAEILVYEGGILGISSVEYGVWIYDGEWTHLVPFPAVSLALEDNALAASFEDHGVWVYYDEWRNIFTQTADLLALRNNLLVASFIDHGVWSYRSGPTMITPTPAELFDHDSSIFAGSFYEQGTWFYDGHWQNLTSEQAEALACGNGRAAISFADYGVWLYE